MLVFAQPHPNRNPLPDGTAVYDYFDGFHVLTEYTERPNARLLHSFNNLPIQLAYCWLDDIIWLLYRFNNTLWSDVSFTAQLLSRHDANFLKRPPPGHRYPINFVLIDSSSENVAGLRVAYMTPRISQNFRRHALKQLELPYDSDEHDATIERIYRKYPTSAAMLDLAESIETIGQETATTP